MEKYFVRLMGPRPMVLFTIAFIIGILSEFTANYGAVIVLICMASVAALSIIFRKQIPLWISLSILLMLSGSIRVDIYNMRSRFSLSNYLLEDHSIHHVIAQVIETGETKRGTPKYLLAPLWIDQMSITEGYIILYSKDIAVFPEPGDTLSASMEIQVPGDRRNPNDFNYREYLRKRRISYEAFIHDTETLTLHPSESFQVIRWIASARELIKIHYFRTVSPQSAGILSALILGERGKVGDEIKKDFANTGVIHVLAVSGLHVGYVTMILMTVIGMLRFSHRIQIILVIAGLGAYVVLTGAAASVTRASLMASLVLVSTLIERKTDIFNVLATAAFIILILNPAEITGIGFQLSFAAVLSIVSLFPKLKEWMPAMGAHPSRVSRIFSTLVDLFLVSLAAQLGTLALTIFYFNKIPLISLFANLVVVPLIGLIVATGMASLIVGSFLTPLALLWGSLLDGLIDFLLWFVHVCSKLSWAYLETPSIDITEVLIIIIAIFSITLLGKRRLPALWIILILLWGNYRIWPNLFQRSKLELFVLDVGQGDGLVIHTPKGKTIVIDTGLKYGGKDKGKDVISPFLISRNWENIDLLILTHPHNDHIGGALYLLEHHPVDQVLIQSVDYDSYGYRKLQNALETLNIPRRNAYTGMIDSSFYPLCMRVMGPKYFDSDHEPSNVNNVSIVVQMFYGETTVLFTGDAEQEVERDQLAFGQLLKSDLIKVPHHGSRTSSTPQYLDLVEPETAAISVGEGNRYGHPADITLSHYETRNIKVNRTDRDGALYFTSDGKEWTPVNWRMIDGF